MNIRSLSDTETLLKFRADCNKVFNQFVKNTSAWRTKKPIVERYVNKLLMTHLLFDLDEVEVMIKNDYLLAAINGEVSVTDQLHLLETDLYYAVLLYRYIWITVQESTIRTSVELAETYKEQLIKYYGHK